MEDSLRVYNNVESRRICILILVLMEDTLRTLLEDSSATAEEVLILVLMEDTLRGDDNA